MCLRARRSRQHPFCNPLFALSAHLCAPFVHPLYSNQAMVIRQRAPTSFRFVRQGACRPATALPHPRWLTSAHLVYSRSLKLHAPLRQGGKFRTLPSTNRHRTCAAANAATDRFSPGRHESTQQQQRLVVHAQPRARLHPGTPAAAYSSPSFPVRKRPSSAVARRWQSNTMLSDSVDRQRVLHLTQPI